MSEFGEFDGEPMPRITRRLIVTVLLLLIAVVAFLLTAGRTETVTVCPTDSILGVDDDHRDPDWFDCPYLTLRTSERAVAAGEADQRGR